MSFMNAPLPQSVGGWDCNYRCRSNIIISFKKYLINRQWLGKENNIWERKNYSKVNKIHFVLHIRVGQLSFYGWHVINWNITKLLLWSTSLYCLLIFYCYFPGRNTVNNHFIRKLKAQLYCQTQLSFELQKNIYYELGYIFSSGAINESKS